MKIIVQILNVAAFSFCLSLMLTGITAQTLTTGKIEGAMTDQNGVTVPGMVVQVSGIGLIRPQTVTTDHHGIFHAANLPPGNYTVTIEAAKGFARFEKTGVGVSLSRTTSLNVILQNAGADSRVNPALNMEIDVKDNTTGSNISTKQFSNFPIRRTIQSLFTIAPTVARSGLRDAAGRDRDPSVAGSSALENNYIFDGVITNDPAFGASGSNLPIDFVQEVEIKTGAFGAEYGKATGGIFNVITKKGTNEFRGDVFAFFSNKNMVRDTKNFPFTGSVPNGFSEIDFGFDVGGPIIKDRLWFFGGFNPQRRENNFLTQTFRQEVKNEITTPFYTGKLTWAVNNNHTFTFSTFGDQTKEKGFLFGSSGFGSDPTSFRGTVESGGQNYSARLNSIIGRNWISEFSFGLHLQRANTIPEQGTVTPQVTDSFAIFSNGQILTPTSTNVIVDNSTGFGDFVNGTGGRLERNFIRQGFGLYTEADLNRWELVARFQNIWGRHTFKYGFEFARQSYTINKASTGPSQNFNGPGGTDPNLMVSGYRVTNNFGVCAVVGTTIQCPSTALRNRIQALLNAGVNLGGGINAVVATPVTLAQLSANPFLIRTSTRVRDFQLHGDPYTNTESFYFQDNLKLSRNFQFNLGLRWDFQQAAAADGQSYLKLNNFRDNLQPRIGFVWDFTRQGKGKVFANYARFLEAPIPLEVNLRAGGGAETDKNFNVNRLNAGPNAFSVSSFGNLGQERTPIAPGLKPQTVNEWTAGLEYEVSKGQTFGFRGIYRAQGSVIEDGSFDDGDNYFLLNPGETDIHSILPLIPNASPAYQQQLINEADRFFGRGRRYYRALEFTATKRFSNNFQFFSSYVFSGLNGNYEGLFRKDTEPLVPNISKAFDIYSLSLNNYGRLPNDRPHQFKFDGSYQFPFKLLVGASFRAQSGVPFNALIPHPVYDDDDSFAVPRGTAAVPTVQVSDPNFPNNVDSIGSKRTPTTYNLDLTGSYPWRIDEKRELRFQVDWFNVFNTQRAVSLDESFQLDSGLTGISPINNPFYGAGRIFQSPSNLRLGVKFKF